MKLFYEWGRNKEGDREGEIAIETKRFNCNYFIWCVANCNDFYGCKSYNNPNFQNFGVGLFAISIGILFCAYSIWQVFEQKKLISYSSDLRIEKKRAVIDKLLQEENIRSVTKEDNYVRYNQFEKRSTYSYDISLVYSESCYFINAIQVGAKLNWFSEDGVNEIIDKIKKVEAEL